MTGRTVTVGAAPAAKRVPAAALTRHLNAGRRKAEKLEPKLAAVLKRIFDQQADQVADAFARKATHHLTAHAGVNGRSHEYVAPPGVTGSTKAMIALYPTAEQADALAEDGTDPATLHCTLAFLGEITADQAQAVAAALQRVAAEHGPLAGIVGGIASFDDNGDGHPAIVLPDVPGLVELRQAAVEASDAAGVTVARNHGFTAHITIAYRDDGPTPPSQDALGQPLTFRSLHVVQGDRQVVAHPLTGPGALTADAALPDWSPPAPNEIIDVDALVSTLRTKTDPVRLAVIQDSMEPGLNAAGLSFDATNPLTAKVLAQSGSQVTNIAQTTQLNVMRTISASYNQGLSIPDTATAIRSGMKEASEARATLIARTELVGAVNGGSLAATQIVADETGVAYTKEWLTSPGAKFPRHEEYDGLDGQQRQMDEPFEVGADQLQFPGDPDGSPEEVCNCHCTLVYADGTEVDADNAGVDAAPATLDREDDFASVIDTSEVGVESAQVVHDALGSIAQVHDFPAGASTLRATTSDTERGLAFDANNGTLLVPQGGLSASDEHAIVHEYGHFLDKTVLGTSGRFASVSGETQGVLNAIGRTDASKVWADAASRSFESPQESFARAYEQWIASRSGNAEMRAEQEAATHRGVPSYWTDADFKQVGSAMDDLFRSSGLLRESAESLTPLQADLAAIRSRAEWITQNDALRKLVASHETTDAAAQAAAQERYGVGPHGELPQYVREQFHATVAAGERVEQELTASQITDEFTAKLEDLSQQAIDLESGRGARLKPFEDAADAAEKALTDFSAGMNDALAQALFGKPYADLDFNEILDVGRKIASGDLPADVKASRMVLLAADARARNALVHERSAWLGEKQKVDKKLRELRGDKVKAERDDVLRVLSEIRLMGPGDGVDITTFGEQEFPGAKEAVAALDSATPFYPRAWINDMPLMQPGTDERRGYHQVLGKSPTGRVLSKIVTTDRPVVATGDSKSTSVALHELGHAVEATRPDVVASERAFYEYRTRGGSFTGVQEPTQKMATLRPGYSYDDREVAREDKFAEPYMGKDYGGRAYELLTMGMEGLFSGTEELDPEYRRWLLGILALA